MTWLSQHASSDPCVPGMYVQIINIQGWSILSRSIADFQYTNGDKTIFQHCSGVKVTTGMQILAVQMDQRGDASTMPWRINRRKPGLQHTWKLWEGWGMSMWRKEYIQIINSNTCFDHEVIFYLAGHQGTLERLNTKNSYDNICMSIIP